MRPSSCGCLTANPNVPHIKYLILNIALVKIKWNLNIKCERFGATDPTLQEELASSLHLREASQCFGARSFTATRC